MALSAIIAIASLGAGILIGVRMEAAKARDAQSGISIVKLHPANASSYKYTAPLLGCYVYNKSKELLEDTAIQKLLTDTLDAMKEEGKIDDGSAYFRGLENGSWAGVNQHASYEPASLFKVPILLAYLKKAEADPTILTQRIKLVAGGGKDSVQEIPPTAATEPDGIYTIDELLKYMTVNSDNAATNALQEFKDIIDSNSFVEVMTDLGISPPIGSNKKYLITPKQYGRFFSVLYNATYLSPDMSEKALRWLASSDFNDGLRAGVPKEVAVAHKFGESGTLQGNAISSRELHDCGIVYIPKKPYALCVMTKGKNLNDLERTIAAVSSAVYGAVSAP